MKHAPMIFIVVILTAIILLIEKQEKTQTESIRDSFSNTSELAKNLSKAYALLDNSREKLSASLEVAVVIANSSNTLQRNSEISKYKKLLSESFSLREASQTIINNSVDAFNKSVEKHKEKFGY